MRFLKPSTLFLVGFCVTLLTINHKTFAHTLTTPRNTTVIHSHPSDTGWWGYQYGEYGYYTQTQWTVYSDSFYVGIYDERIDRANQAYNCHAYAWANARQLSSSSWCWINTPEDNKYWNDESYAVISQGYATHVNYGEGESDHSLIIESGNTVTSNGNL
ncbi:MAG: hypothetical protein SCK70_10740 [bacterium]|nr:hypothetical protein [bacterium]